MLQTLIDRIGEDWTLALAGLSIGLAFGFLAQRSRFCQRPAVIEFWRSVSGGKLTVWLFAVSTAVLATQAVVLPGLFDASDAREIAARGNLSGAASGGALFGMGMILARGCSSRLLVLAAQGNLRSVIAGLVFAVTAQAAWTGALAPLRQSLSEMLMFRTLLAMAAFVSLFAAAPAAAQAPKPKAVQVAPDTYMVQGMSALGSSANRNFISNAAFVVTPQGVLVVDALGSPALALELLAEIRRITPAPVRYVVLTHYHADHIYGLQAFKDAGATIIAHKDGQLYLNSETAELRLKASREELAPAVDSGTRLVPADRWIDQRTTLRLGGLDFVLQPAGPAHTPEDLVVWVPQLKLLMAGDLVFRGRIPFVGQADSGRWITSMDTLLAFDASVIVPGHGPVSQSARADLELTRDYLVYLRKTMGEAARNMDPFEEAYARTDWSRFDKLPLFGAANRINAYNTYLLMEQVAK